MEWRPEAYNGQYVALSDLGKIYWILTGSYEPSDDWLRVDYEPTQITVRAFVSQVLLPSFGQQKVFIIVQDQQFKPVPNAMLEVNVYFPGQDEPVSYRPEATNLDGITTLVFSVGQLQPKEIVPIEVTASFQDLDVRTTTWFRVWW